jgi:hypothetical protein
MSKRTAWAVATFGLMVAWAVLVALLIVALLIIVFADWSPEVELLVASVIAGPGGAGILALRMRSLAARPQ